MKFYRAFRLSSSLLMVTGILSLALAEGTLLYVSIAVAACLVNWFFVEKYDRPLYERPVGNFLMVAALAYAVYDLTVCEFYVLAMAHLLLFVQIIRLFQRKTNRDHLMMYLISLMHLGAASLMTADLLFACCFLIYMVVGTWTLTLFHLKRQAEANHAALSDLSEEQVDGRCPALSDRKLLNKTFFLSTSLVTILALAVSITTFVVFPRIGMGVLGVTAMHGGSRMIGFSDNVALGDVGEIMTNRKTVMRVALRKDGAPYRASDVPLRWRGVVLDYYNGRSWEKTAPEYRDQEFDNQVIYWLRRFARVPSGTGPLVEQEIVLEPIGSRALFFLHEIRRVHSSSLARARFDTLRLTLSSLTPIRKSIRYVAVSRLVASEEHIPSDRATRPSIDLARYTMLPKDPPISERVRELAADIVDGIPESAVLERVEAVERYLGPPNYGYTLKLDAESKGEPVDDFLFRRKMGHCEYFASAMVVLLRCLKIPCRMVCGFAGGEWNDVGKYYLIRQSHAHSWVEVYLEDAQTWLPFDPTPSSGRTGVGRRDSPGALNMYVDLLRLYWLRYVINYDLDNQVGFLSAMARAPARVADWFRSLGTLEVGGAGGGGGPSGGALLAVLLLLAALVVAAVWTLRKLRMKGLLSPKHRKKAASVQFYREMLEILAKHGYRRDVSRTPAEFAQRVIEQGGTAYQEVPMVTDRFYEVRYGNRPVSRETLARIETALTELRQLPRSPSAREKETVS